MLKLLQVAAAKRHWCVPYCHSLKQTTLNGTNFWGVNTGVQGWISVVMQRSSWNGTVGFSSFTSSTWFICWFHRLHWSSCVTTTDLSRLLSGLCIINGITILQWDLNFSILLMWEPKSMLFVSCINSARPTKTRKSVNKLIRADKRIDVSCFSFFCWLKLQFLEWIACLKQKMLC